MTKKISVFENSNKAGAYYTFDQNVMTGETIFTSVYFPKGYKASEIKTTVNGKKYITCSAEYKVSANGKPYYQVKAEQ